ncbi:phage holin family protein [Acinetobacter bereziniae]|nr:phage holin family protein [Acinetobacter bereziniae]
MPKSGGGMEFWKWVQELIGTFGTAVTSFFMGFVMAYLRTKKKAGKGDFAESIMCGLFAVGVWTFLEWFNIPQIVAVGLASCIGYMGTHFVSNLIEKKVDNEINR